MIQTTIQRITSILATIAATSVLACSAIHAGEAPAKKTGSPELERMKSLVGTWKGKTDMGQGPVEMTIQYRTIAAGSVVEERIFPGTENEMVTMYYDNEKGKLALTHYCMLGNRPMMYLTSSDGQTMKFAFDKACGINPKKESHMHAMTLNFVDANTISSSCKGIMDGKEMPEHTTTLRRVNRKS